MAQREGSATSTKAAKPSRVARKTVRSGAARPTRDGETPLRRGTSAEKRALILETATQVSAEKGYHDTRISDIAKRAQVAYGLVYHYFKNKEEILDTIFLERWGQFISAVRAIVNDSRSVEEKLLSIASVILSAHKSSPEWVKILIFEIRRSQRMLGRDRMEVVGELFELIAQILRDGQGRGELRTDLDPEMACYLFVGGLDTVVTSRVLELMPVEGGGPADESAHHTRDAHYDQLATTIVSLFLRGMAVEEGRDGSRGARTEEGGG